MTIKKLFDKCEDAYLERDYKRLLELSDEALEKDPNNQTAMGYKSVAYCFLGCPQKAVKILEQAIRRYPNNYYLRGLTTEGIFGEAVNADNGLSFNMEGGFDGYGDIYFILEQDGDDVFITISCVGDVDTDFSVDGQFCLEVNDQRYIYYVKLVSPELYEAGE